MATVKRLGPAQDGRGIAHFEKIDFEVVHIMFKIVKSTTWM